MYKQKRIFIFSTLCLVGMLGTSVAAATTRSNEKPSPSTAEPAESSEKIEEPISFCSINGFLKSDFIRTSVWPGVGPFDVSNPASTDSSETAPSTKLIDPSHNALSYVTKGDEINTCELELHNSISESQGLLNLQIATDFLLEGLGVKPRQIHIVNSELSKKSNSLSGNNYNPVSVIIAPLTVSFQNLGKKEGTNNPVLRVAIVNQKAPAEEISQTTQTDNASNDQKASENKTSEIDAASAPSSTADKSEPAENQTVTKNIELDNTAAANSKSSTESSAKSNQPASNKAPSAKDALKEQFLNLIVNWQHIKKTAVLERKTNELSQVLAGKALVRQSDAIKWLTSNHKYYEMLSQNAAIEHVDTLVQGKKYAVFAEVKEKTKFMDETSKKTLKETDDTYKVNYTVEKIGSHWLITDSALIKPNEKRTSQIKPKH